MKVFVFGFGCGWADVELGFGETAEYGGGHDVGGGVAELFECHNAACFMF